MSVTIPLADLALALRGHIVAGTFDSELVNSYLRPYAEIVLPQPSSPSTQTFGRSNHSSWLGAGGSSNLSMRHNSIPLQYIDPSLLADHTTLRVLGSSCRPNDSALLLAKQPLCFLSDWQEPVHKRRRLSSGDTAIVHEASNEQGIDPSDHAIYQSPSHMSLTILRRSSHNKRLHQSRIFKDSCSGLLNSYGSTPKLSTK